MKKVTVVYWSGTGNTEQMAIALAEGAKEAGAEVNIMSVDKASKDEILNAGAIALGCPSMGAEVLEESEFEPFMEAIEGSLGGKALALFGSYDWGDGEWMRNWEERVKSAGAMLVEDGLIAHLTPDEDALNACKELGKSLA